MKKQDNSRNLILVNPAPHGIGPILHTAYLVQELCRLLKAQNPGVTYEIIFPERKEKAVKDILLNEIFVNDESVWLSPKLGEILGRFGFKTDDYIDRLHFIAENRANAEKEFIDVLQSGLKVYNLANQKQEKKITAEQIFCEINHNPIIRTCTDNSFPMLGTSIGLFSEILQHAGEIILRYNEKEVKAVVLQCIKEAKAIEASQSLIMVAEPSSLSYRPFNETDKIKSIPPIKRTFAKNHESLKKGVYLNISGIESVQKQIVALAKPFMDAGYAVYYPPSYKQGIEGGIEKAPVERGIDIFSNPAIIAAAGRMGWGSVWGPMMNGSPFITYEYDDKEDPEMHHNVKTLEQLGIGVVMKQGDNPKDVMEKALALKPGIKNYLEQLKQKYGTLNGAVFAAGKACHLLTS